MTPTAELAATARNLMVDGQVRPNKVYDPRLLAAMRSLPREQFLPPRLAARAYLDETVDLGGGRFLIAPMVIARMVEAAAVRAGQRVLVVAAGSGYGAALLAACGARVTALEDDPALLELARSILPEVAPGVALIEAAHGAGHPAGAPYDLIFIEGAVELVPEALVGQLAALGRLIAIRATPGASGAAQAGQVVMGEPVAGHWSLQPLFDCAVPLLPAMRREAGFVF